MLQTEQINRNSTFDDSLEGLSDCEKYPLKRYQYAQYIDLASEIKTEISELTVKIDLITWGLAARRSAENTTESNKGMCYSVNLLIAKRNELNYLLEAIEYSVEAKRLQLDDLYKGYALATLPRSGHLNLDNI